MKPTTNYQLPTTNYQPVIGLEVHVELKTKSKMFCGCDNKWFAERPNTHTCPVCLGLPGALPVPNKQAIEWCIKIGMALNCEIPLISKFDRKNYFYPDLSKGYQISQYDQPFAVNGYMVLSNGKRIGITRVHMEEDTGKLLHQTLSGQNVSLIDFNRSGSPLVEIVTEPDFDNAKDVKEYLRRLRQTVRDLEVSDADMEKGQMRLEPNISLRLPSDLKENTLYKLRPLPLLKIGDTREQLERKQIMDSTQLPPYKVEVKNINSFSFVEKAINYEIKRQQEILESGQTPKQETMGWNEEKQETVPQRSKEEAMDYRYFPEPDIPPFTWTEKQRDKWKNEIPDLQDKKIKNIVENLNIKVDDAVRVTEDVQVAKIFEEAVKLGKQYNIPPQQIANVLINKKNDVAQIVPTEIVKQIVESQKIESISENELLPVLQKVIADNPKAVEDYKKGKETVIMFLVGMAMKELKGKAKAEIVREKLQELLQK